MCIDTLEGKQVPIKLWTDKVEDSAREQLLNIASLPWCFKHVAVMPDVHWGMGATVGSVIAMKDALAPAAVGVDIGCGMSAVRTSLTANDLPDNLRELRSEIEAVIPVGFAKHDEYLTQAHTHALPLWNEFRDLDESVADLCDNAMRQVGTLGGGNHFIELCLDEDDRVWMMLHSGSRNIGNRLARVHIARAKKLAHNADLPDRDLAVFLSGTPEMEAYRRDLYWAQRYAAFNREVMMGILADVLRDEVLVWPGIVFDPPISCHHNYVAEETHFGEDVIVTRKGAISAREGEMGIIPGSMGTRSYIVEGLGNPEAFHSASHGAGRVMGRKQAKRTFTLDDFLEQTEGVECRKDKDLIDEIPGAYKDIDQVMVNQADLVRIKHKLRAVLCVKG